MAKKARYRWCRQRRKRTSKLSAPPKLSSVQRRVATMKRKLTAARADLRRAERALRKVEMALSWIK